MKKVCINIIAILTAISAGSSALAANYPDEILSTNSVPLHYYRFGDAGSTAADSSGSADGTTVGASLSDSTAMTPSLWNGFEVGNQSAALNGSSDYIELGSQLHESLYGASAVTIEAWVNRDTISDDNMVFFMTSATNGGAGIALEIEASGVRFTARSTASDSYQNNFKSIVISTGEWHQVVGVFDYANQTISTYVDGLPVGPPIAQSGWTSSTLQFPTNGTVRTVIGANANNIPESGHFDGNIDEVSVYNTALSAWEVRAHYNLARSQETESYEKQIASLGPKHYYRFGDAGTTVADSSIEGTDGVTTNGAVLNSSTAMTPTNFPGFASDNKSLALNGTDDSVDFGNDLINSLNGVSAVTIEAWVNLDSADNQQVFHTQFTGGTAMALEIEASGIRVGARSTAGDGFQSIFKSYAAFSVGEWHQVVAVLNYAADTLQLFVDGQPVGGPVGRTFGSSTLDLATASDTGSRIGALTSDSSFFTGYIDEVAIYDRALSDAEIEANYDAAFTSAASLYQQWAGLQGLTAGVNDGATDDPDSDGLDNLAEYALGGAPLDANDQGSEPYIINSDAGLSVIYVERTDDDSLTYSLQTRDDLLTGSWTNTGYTVSGTNITGSTFNDVTNSIQMETDTGFIRLVVEQL